MGSRLFSVSRRAAHCRPANSEVISKLTAIRVAGYNKKVVDQQLSEQNHKDILLLTKQLGEKVLKVNLINSEGTKVFKAARIQFNEVINNLAQKGTFPLVFYAAQLLQFYTIICDDKFEPNLSPPYFQKLLADNIDNYGDTNSNLFIAEYKLTIIYNNLVSSGDLYANTDAVMQDSDPKMPLLQLKLTLNQLESLKENIDKWLLEATDNVFVHYLSFIYQYTLAKALEFQFVVQERQLSDESKLELSKTQETHLTLAKEALDSLDELNRYFEGRGESYSNGLEFSLGQGLLHKLPETNLNELRTHVISLLSISTNTDETSI
jgi:flagellar basal body rod protein FlgB